MGGVCAIIDAEHALDPAYARKLGVDVDDLFISQPDTGEQALEIAEALVRSAAFDVVAIDSVAALVPRAELEGEMGDTHVGLQARLMSQALRKLTGAINRSRTSLIFTNQLREKIGVMFGNPETTPGGRALKFYASVRLDVRRIDSIKQGTDVVGSRVKVKVVKNKVAPPFRVAEFDIMYNEGISKEGGLLDLAVELGLVKKTGAFFSYGETRLGQGRENAREFLKKNREMAQEIERLIRQQTLAGAARGVEVPSPQRPRSLWEAHLPEPCPPPDASPHPRGLSVRRTLAGALISPRLLAARPRSEGRSRRLGAMASRRRGQRRTGRLRDGRAAERSGLRQLLARAAPDVPTARRAAAARELRQSGIAPDLATEARQRPSRPPPRMPIGPR